MRKSLFNLLFIMCMVFVIGVSAMNSYIIYAAPSISGDDLLPTITSSTVHIDENLDCISKISVGTTVGMFYSYLDETTNVTVRKNEKVVSSSELLGTGMNACIMQGDVLVKEYTVIVTGDTNGDGKINITDMIAVKAGVLKKSNLTGVYAKASDVNGDGKINITDFIKIKAVTIKKDTITGVVAP